MHNLALSFASDREKLLKEVTTMLSFAHPNVMSLIGVCLDEDVPHIIMPYMPNGTVLAYVKKNKEELHFEVQSSLDQVGIYTYVNCLPVTDFFIRKKEIVHEICGTIKVIL